MVERIDVLMARPANTVRSGDTARSGDPARPEDTEVTEDAEVTGVSSPAVDRRDPEGVIRVADSLIDLMRTVRRSKAGLLAAGNDVESATQLLLRTVAGEGPLRASALAASVGSDLSTVSRQVAALVGRGLLERRADQLDGRASLLVVTKAGRAVIAAHEQGRRRFFEDVLAGWSADELEVFARSLARFTSSYDRTHTAWIADRAGAPRPRTAAGTGDGATGSEGDHAT